MSARPLHIVSTPSLYEGLWADGIRAAAEAKGLTFGRWDKDQADILITDMIPAHRVMDLDPSEWVILADSSAAALTAMGYTFGESPPGSQSAMHCSGRFIGAAWLAERGSAVLGQRAMALNLPKLGLVSPRKCDIVPDAPGPLASLLTLYDRLPIRTGAKSVWGPEQFSFPIDGKTDGGPASVDLTGRGRLLMHGPNMWLPPGRWRATLRMAINPDRREVPLSFDWGCYWGADRPEVNDVVSVAETIDEAGYYTVALENGWDVPGPAMVRIHLTQPLFQGVLEFLDCTVERVPDLEPKPDSEV